MNSNFLNKNFFINFIIVSLIFLLDRITKYWVIKIANENFASNLYESKFLNINLIWNEGIAFGLFSFEKNYFYDLLTILIVIIVVIIFVMALKNEGYKKYALLIILGGALGNLYDRISFRSVPDFIDFHIGDFHWFIFNVSDIFISIGVLFMIFLELKYNNKKN
tara:strand:- start:566 stop:1057 length:492 start_codon:yes stop_codon:yes gene_type:complete